MSKYPFHNLYLYIGAVFSLVYIAVGIFFITGSKYLGMDTLSSKLLGVVIILYGLFRVYTFYKRFNDSKKNNES